MINAQWARVHNRAPLPSLHIVRFPISHTENHRAYCGKVLTTHPQDVRPAGKTCESCYRIAGPK